jgi:uncharacterized protein YgiB involved in biofilm formation
MRRRRSSVHISLVLIGGALAGCGPEAPRFARDHYATLEDCAADWGRPDQCDRVQSSGYPGGAFVFRGPPYPLNAREEARRAALAEAQRAGRGADPARQGRSIGQALEPTTRGGFGASARSYSAGG